MKNLDEIKSRFLDVQQRILHCTPSASPASTLIAVSKTHSVEAIEALYHLGQRDFGENYAQELLAKASALESKGCKDIRWHMIGHLQTNKVKMLLPLVHCIHTVDSLKVAQEINKRAQALGRPKVPVFIEVNIDAEKNKSGVSPSEVKALLQALEPFTTLQVEGLMCIPEYDQSNSEIEKSFLRLQQLLQECGKLTRHQLSMGMSHDLEIAIQCGATHVRVGTAIFGERPSP